MDPNIVLLLWALGLGGGLRFSLGRIGTWRLSPAWLLVVRILSLAGLLLYFVDHQVAKQIAAGLLLVASAAGAVQLIRRRAPSGRR